MANCTHVPAHWASRYAPIHCPTCGGFVDPALTVMNRETTLARYPEIASVVDHAMPAPPPPLTRVQRADLGVQLAGRAARQMLLAIFAAIALALMIGLLVLIVSWA